MALDAAGLAKRGIVLKLVPVFTDGQDWTTWVSIVTQNAVTCDVAGDTENDTNDPRPILN